MLLRTVCLTTKVNDARGQMTGGIIRDEYLEKPQKGSEKAIQYAEPFCGKKAFTWIRILCHTNHNSGTLS